MNNAVEAVFRQVSDSPEIGEKIEQIVTGKKHVVFNHVAESAQPFLVALIAHRVAQPSRRVWVLCENERAQERFQLELSCWFTDAIPFPHLEIAAVEGALPDPEVSAERLGVLQRLSDPESSPVIVINGKSLAEKVPPPAILHQATLEMRKGERLDRESILTQLNDAGYESVVQVAERGQYSIRGGVMDVYSWQQALPIRLEWFDNEIESIREFEIDQQTSVRSLERCAVLLKVPEGRSVELRNYLKKTDLTISVGNSVESASIHITSSSVENGADPEEQYHNAFFPSPLDTRQDVHQTPALVAAAHDQTTQQLEAWRDNDYLIVVCYHKSSEKSSVQSILSLLTPNLKKSTYLPNRSVSSFVYPAGKLAVVSAAEILGHCEALAGRRSQSAGSRRGLLKQRSQIDFTELTEGKLVVHLEHGLARFLGLENHSGSGGKNAREDDSQEVMVLEFAEGAKLFVPLEQAFLVSRYVGLGKRGSALSHLGDGKWSSTKKAAEKSIYDYAAQLLKIQAVREAHLGFVFGPDGAWQREFRGIVSLQGNGRSSPRHCRHQVRHGVGVAHGPAHLR